MEWNDSAFCDKKRTLNKWSGSGPQPVLCCGPARLRARPIGKSAALA